EGGRALLRGLVSDDTTLIASSHREYAIVEKIDMGDGRKSGDDIRAIAADRAGRFICADMREAAQEANSVISSVLFGALAGSGALPFPRSAFEETIRSAGIAVDSNLSGFARGFGAAISIGKSEGAPAASMRAAERAPSRAVAPLIGRLDGDYPPKVRAVVKEGLRRLVDYQNVNYAAIYLSRLDVILARDRAQGGETRDWRLTQETARHLALAMSFEDTIRVADLKTRSTRFTRFREDVKADTGQIVNVSEYLHPRIEEFCDILPAPLGGAILNSKIMRAALSPFFRGGRRVPTTKLRGFLLLNLLGSLKFMRRASLRYRVENERIDAWLAAIGETAAKNYDLACEVAALQGLIKGYGETHARGLASYSAIMAALPALGGRADASALVRKLRDAALKDEEGVFLKKEIKALNASPAAA
ncbi:MAG: indolepyruvate oxidoreductase subunit beta family protein, partial [Parvularculaceae bacterium]